jgi:hypothetical protein
MSFARGKQKYTREEIIEILKRNTTLFKDDEVFTQYIIDLASFLIEYRLFVERSKPPAPAEVVDQRKWLSRTSDRNKELGDVLKKHASHIDTRATCKMCGGPTGGSILCPNCGGMAI